MSYYGLFAYTEDGRGRGWIYTSSSESIATMSLEASYHPYFLKKLVRCKTRREAMVMLPEYNKLWEEKCEGFVSV